jgi:predicted thioesterase
MTPTGTGSSLHFDVTDDDTALALGSGDVPVLATPRLLAWLEAASCAAASRADLLGEGGTSVGTRITLDHLLATGVGGGVEARADLVHQDGRLLRFALVATDGSGRVIATGEVTRVVVDRARFVDRIPAV